MHAWPPGPMQQPLYCMAFRIEVSRPFASAFPPFPFSFIRTGCQTPSEANNSQHQPRPNDEPPHPALPLELIIHIRARRHPWRRPSPLRGPHPPKWIRRDTSVPSSPGAAAWCTTCAEIRPAAHSTERRPPAEWVVLRLRWVRGRSAWWCSAPGSMGTCGSWASVRALVAVSAEPARRGGLCWPADGLVVLPSCRCQP